MMFCDNTCFENGGYDVEHYLRMALIFWQFLVLKRGSETFSIGVLKIIDVNLARHETSGEGTMFYICYTFL